MVVAAVTTMAVTALFQTKENYAEFVTYSQANEFIWDGLELPNSATEVTYFVSHRTCEVKFLISEMEFKKWCEKNRWELTPITEDGIAWNPECPGKIDSGWSVASGYEFEPLQPNSRFKEQWGGGTFDAEETYHGNGRCWTTFYVTRYPE